MTYPTSRWVKDGTYRDRIVYELAPGEYRFVFGVWLSDSKAHLATSDDPERGAVDLGWYTVGDG